MFFKASVGPGVHAARSDSQSLAFVEKCSSVLGIQTCVIVFH